MTTKRAARSVRVLTLNMAHGRGTSFHQLFTGYNDIRQNLDAVARLIRVADADLVALQELDQASSWSGGFDHLEYLARQVGYPYHFHGLHVARDKPRLAYGTGVLSRFPIESGISRAFAQNLLDTKGYVLTRIDAPVGTLDLVSLHLDFKRTRERRTQLEFLAERLLDGDRTADHLVVAGDFNCRIRGRDRVLSSFVDDQELVVAECTKGTFPSRKPKRRIDYVLISEGLEYQQRMVVPARLSDHLPVLAELRTR